MDLADILTTSEEEPQQAPDSASDPAAALDFHRLRWPLNSKVAAGTVAAGEGSDRIRPRMYQEQKYQSRPILEVLVTLRALQ